MSAQLERMGPWAITPCCLRLKASHAPGVRLGQEPSVKGNRFVLKARGFILKFRIGCPRRHRPLAPIPAFASLARRVQFEQSDGYNSVQTLAEDLDADRNLNNRDLADTRCTNLS
jgi:hypothetical protein